MCVCIIIELTPKIISKAFWVGEVENEIRKMEKSDYVFKSDADLENCMDMIEEERQMCIYPHPDNDCTPECKERGLLQEIIGHTCSHI